MDTNSAATDGSAHFTALGEGEYHARIGATFGLALVLFSAPHCGACRAWKRLLETHPAFATATLYEVDVSIATGVAHYFGIFHLPTLYLYRAGHFHAELRCPLDARAVAAHVERLLAGPAEDEP